MSAIDNLGPHLLGRLPSKPDPRDYRLADYLGDSTADPIDTAFAALKASLLVPHVVKAWAMIATKRIKATSPPTPVPTPPAPPTPIPTPPAPTATDTIYLDPDGVLDQGQTSECVGNGWAGWADSYPGIDAHYLEADAHNIYEQCTVIDGDPGAENGSTVKTGAQVMRNMKRLNAYAFAASIDEVRAWLDTHGPVVFGTEWTQQMFTPDANGFVSPSDGNVQGGHCFVCVGDVPSKGALEFQNSWGSIWGTIPGSPGRFYMTYADAAALLAGLNQQDGPGEACAAVELP